MGLFSKKKGGDGCKKEFCLPIILRDFHLVAGGERGGKDRVGAEEERLSSITIYTEGREEKKEAGQGKGRKTCLLLFKGRRQGKEGEETLTSLLS